VKKPCHIVFTTIHHPAILRDLYANIHRHGHLDEVKVWVVGDRKTPSSAATLAAEVSALGLETVYFGVEGLGYASPRLLRAVAFKIDAKWRDSTHHDSGRSRGEPVNYHRRCPAKDMGEDQLGERL
jgi:hypothetical protein